MSDALQREEELQVLQSIYPDYITEFTSDYVRLEVPIELGQPRDVYVAKDTSQRTDSVGRVAHLPPIILTIKLPQDYPTSSPPLIFALHSLYNWLACCAKLLRLLRTTWTEGEGVLCTWVELVRSGEFLDQLGLVDNSGLIQLENSDTCLLLTLQDYDRRAFSTEFSQTSFTCAICFDSLKGARCIRLSCSHVFCRPCLQAYWGSSIAEGSIEQVSCADPACVKDRREASEEDVMRVVTEKELIRWKWLKTKKAIEKDPSIIHCPIPICQAPVPKPPTDPRQASAWDRFRSCAACAFSFCSFCKHTWHGPLSECPKSVTLALIMEYLDLPEDSPGRRALERKFGTSAVLKLVRDYKEEKSTTDWLQNSTTECPGCHVHVEKSLGCNHMACVRCKQHFCYRCGAKLSATNPYEHFSTIGSGCHGKLFDLPSSHGEDDWQPIGAIDLL